MSLWKIKHNKPQKINETNLLREKLLEENLENWIALDPSLLGEPLLVIGRQVLIPDTKDRLDLLALDPQGAAVVIELKRGHLKDPVDVQALRYASYISKWRFEDFENIARNHLGKVGDPDFNFNALFESFCEDAGADEIPDLNREQRIIIVGSAVRDKLGSVALWLREHSVDIKLIEVKAYKEADEILIEPTTIVPLAVSRFTTVGRGSSDGTPWTTDGMAWHLEKRCSPQTKEMMLTLDGIVQEHFEVEGPRWNQKHYVAYRINNLNWLSVQTRQTSLVLDFLIKAKTFNIDRVAKELNIAKFDKEESLSEKFGLPSSVFIRNRNEQTDRVLIRVKEDFNLGSDEFVKFLQTAYKACPRTAI
jgi:hypothetical protein